MGDGCCTMLGSCNGIADCTKLILCTILRIACLFGAANDLSSTSLLSRFWNSSGCEHSSGGRLRLHAEETRKSTLTDAALLLHLFIVAKCSFGGRIRLFGAPDLLHSQVLVFQNSPAWRAYFGNTFVSVVVLRSGL
jgi:hypothetical protein